MPTQTNHVHTVNDDSHTEGGNMAATKRKAGASKRTSKQSAASRKAAARKAHDTRILRQMEIPSLRFADEGEIVTDNKAHAESGE